MKVDKHGEQVPGNALCYPPHSDEDWVLVDGAFNNWLGVIEDHTGAEIMDLTGWAARDFAAAFAFAQLVVRTFNKEVLGIELEDYQGPAQ